LPPRIGAPSERDGGPQRRPARSNGAIRLSACRASPTSVRSRASDRCWSRRPRSAPSPLCSSSPSPTAIASPRRERQHPGVRGQSATRLPDADIGHLASVGRKILQCRSFAAGSRQAGPPPCVLSHPARSRGADPCDRWRRSFIAGRVAHAERGDAGAAPLRRLFLGHHYRPPGPPWLWQEAG
jgi:hypothetical protein